MGLADSDARRQRKALVLGKGRSGEAAAAELRRRGFAVDSIEGYDLVVASPGIPVKSELQLGCEELKRRGWKLLAVTGSKGKSSVVKLVADAIGLAGGRAVPCGNYGRPVCDLVGEEPGWAVVEVSSFQLEATTLAPDTFEAAAVLNLQEDHLDRHGSVAVYHGLKRKLLGFAKEGLGDGERGTGNGEQGTGNGEQGTGNGEQGTENGEQGTGNGEQGTENGELMAGSYFDNEILCANGAAAIFLMRAAGLDDAAIRRAFASFEPLPHRFQKVAESGGATFVDDSKATSVAALVAGVKMCRGPVRLIAGGLPKGDDPKAALPILTERVKKVYLIGHCAESFSAAWSTFADCEICGTLARAVERAKREAAKGETVLLSPGAASFDQFRSFGERGEVFARLVQKGKTEE